MVRAIVIADDDGSITTRVSEVEEADLPEGDVVVDVAYSTVNYKDALAMVNGRPVVASFPMVPGVDFAGTVVSSEHAAWRPGDAVVLNGWGVGERRWGGLAERARVDGDWLVARPGGLSARDCMVIGTAGYTAMLSVMLLEQQGVNPGSGPVLVTGATGGVGSVAVAVLAGLGYEVVAATGKASEEAYLRALGAADVVDRAELSGDVRPLAKQRWGAAIDNVGSVVLANVLAATAYGGTVIACGNAGGMDLPSSVAPFILRGVRLVGVESVMAPIELRRTAWARLATELPASARDAMALDATLADAPDIARRMLAGETRGRYAVDVRS
ncbi:MAG TPA: MDR family oxidoreductase [Acidimicrobiia bacterium]|nr:MDR family oxidoreductase [Acidimicrobiia bacterium]